MTITAFEVRRENVRKLINEKFDGNRSAFSRAAGVHPNQINLVMAENEHRRNLGEDLTRRMEESLGIPTGYFDAEHMTGENSVHKIATSPVPESMSSILRKDDEVEGAVYYNSYLDKLAGKITARENLLICKIATHDMAPEIGFDERVMVDLGVKAVSVDGVYIIGRGSDLFLRRVTKQITGGWCILTPKRDPVHVDSLKGMRAVGKIVMAWRRIVM